MDEYSKSIANNDFSRARTKALINDFQHFYKPEETDLLSLSDVKQLLRPKNEVYLGMSTVPIENIVGSEGRYRDFDKHFFPRSAHLRNRWERIDQAHINNIILPPITLYEIGGLYFVRDGNHRVSVAKSQGVSFIDAEVISLQSEIKLRPGLTKAQILKQVIQYEKRVFYSETGFGDSTDYWDIDFSSPGQYDVIYQHIQIHKYYINQNIPTEISMHEAMLSWFNNVYLPVINVIKEEHILRYFKHRTPSDLYVWLIKYWDDLKQKFGQEFSLKMAAEEFTENVKTNLFTRIKSFFSKKKVL